MARQDAPIGHVRGDVVYRLLPERVQGWIDLVLYFIFFFPGVLALMYAGWDYGAESMRIQEVRNRAATPSVARVSGDVDRFQQTFRRLLAVVQSGGGEIRVAPRHT